MKCDCCGEELREEDAFEIEFRFPSHIVVQTVCPECRPYFDPATDLKEAAAQLKIWVASLKKDELKILFS